MPLPTQVSSESTSTEMTPIPPEIIRVLSLDFDGCLLHDELLYDKTLDIIKYNRAFLDQIKKENQKFKKTYTFVGSLRQSQRIDVNNCFGEKRSCFKEYIRINNYLNTIFEPLLLPDIYSNKIIGNSFRNVIKRNFKGMHDDVFADDTKVNILYAQIHYMALKHPTKKIVFDFYDDRLDILSSLNGFFDKNHHLIPKNVQFQLHHYAGKQTSRKYNIAGSGFIDSNFKQTVKDLTDLALQREQNAISAEIHIAHHADKTDLLVHRTALSSPINSSAELKAEDRTLILDEFQKDGIIKTPFDDILSEIYKKHLQLSLRHWELQKKRSKYAKNYSQACLDSASFYQAIKQAVDDYMQDKDTAKFEVAVDIATSIARESELQNHRGWKEVIAYIGLALISAVTGGLAYGALCFYNSQTSQPSFFKLNLNTDFLNKIDKWEKDMAEVSSLKN